ncbi:MAG: hypothetical protein A2W37_09950 [Chloroflexi bacterium RBG_16_63_12]|nr:MAG: hypothetical protein A2W37_09950 [Chloroflexi bacterium RBG_16_63_12]
MANHLALSARITKELQELERVVERCLDIWAQSEASGDDRYIDGVALNLQSFYTGIERIFELVVAEIDQDHPTGPNWHQELLRLVATEVPKLRPALISDTTRNTLDRYRGFRHVVRNIYSFNLDREQILPLVRDLRYIFETARSDLTRFAETIAKIDLEDSDSV